MKELDMTNVFWVEQTSFPRVETPMNRTVKPDRRWTLCNPAAPFVWEYDLTTIRSAATHMDVIVGRTATRSWYLHYAPGRNKPNTESNLAESREKASSKKQYSGPNLVR